MKLKGMKSFFTAGLLLFFMSVAGASFAQDSKKETRAKALTDTMKTQLALNADQYNQVYTINLDFITKMAALKEDGGSKMSKFSKLKSIDKERDSALKGVLTTEQFKSFEEFKKANREEMKARRKENSSR